MNYFFIFLLETFGQVIVICTALLILIRICFRNIIYAIVLSIIAIMLALCLQFLVTLACIDNIYAFIIVNLACLMNIILMWLNISISKKWACIFLR